MKGRVIIIISVVTAILVGVICGYVYFRHNKTDDVVVETTEEYIVEESTEVQYKIPESQHSEVLENVREANKYQYSDTTICATFSEQIRGMCVDVFGEYIGALQNSCAQIQETGYEYFTAYDTDIDTAVLGEGYLEFTVYLPGARGRCGIEKDGNNYVSTFRILDDTELVSDSLYAPDGLDAELLQDAVDYNTPWVNSTNPIYIEGYELITHDTHKASYYTFDSDFLVEMLGMKVMEPIRTVIGVDMGMYDTVSFVLSNADESALSQIAASVDGNAVMCTWGDYIFRIVVENGRPCTDIYLLTENER